MQGRTFFLLAFALVVSGCKAPPRPHYSVADRGGDRDGDGAADIDDSCPDDPEDGLPPKANDGCPAGDWDNDGIARSEDKCPNAKEDRKPPDPTDGCPSSDDDGDGVADALDTCPNELEDNLPPNPSDGCRAPDRDSDGIADAIDACRDQAETYNGYRDDDGCPDTPPRSRAVAYDPESSIVYVPESKKIEFDTDSDRIRDDAIPTIQDVARVLREHPEITRVEIEGHASAKGTDEHNLDLTDRRAIAVARTLESLGIEAARLVPVGYGEFCPAIDTAPEVDEPKNRRVVLKAVVVHGIWRDVPRGCWRALTKGIDPTKSRPLETP